MRIVSLAMLSACLLVGPTTLPVCAADAAGLACCKICRKGKACGDSCIAVDRECHKPRGCACDG